MNQARQRILFLCTGNSCRSQMAEGWARELMGDRFEAHSAGVAPSRVDPRAIRAMAEVGVDISGQTSKNLGSFLGQRWDWVVTLCDHAAEVCPLFPGDARRVHRGFADPPSLARTAIGEDAAMLPYRQVRDQIKALILGLPQSLED